jgi:mono/diheme cytochrome c family protein
LILALPSAPRAQQTASGADRGRYLVVDAGQCADCHGKALEGAPLDFLNPALPPIVQRQSPKIAGLPMFSSDADATHFLESGELPDKSHARPPMPQYRFSHDDAVAIVAYLRTLH